MAEAPDLLRLRAAQDVDDMRRAEALAGPVDRRQDLPCVLRPVDALRRIEADIAVAYYVENRANRPFPQGRASTFLANMDGTPLHKGTVYNAFVRLLRHAGIESTDDSGQAPRLHSLRHSFAVHRLTDWYRQGADVQRLLPVLSTYLGHARLRHTQVYLSMTPELLHQAALRFEHYAGGDNDE